MADSNQRVVLIIEDNLDHAKLYTRLITACLGEEFIFMISTAENEAINRILKHHPDIAIILLDHHLALGTGSNVLKTLARYMHARPNHNWFPQLNHLFLISASGQNIMLDDAKNVGLQEGVRIHSFQKGNACDDIVLVLSEEGGGSAS